MLIGGTYRRLYAYARQPNPWDEIARWLRRLERNGQGWEVARALEAIEADDMEVLQAAMLTRKGRRKQ